MIVLATDSSAYITRQEAKDLGVIYIPMTYTVGEDTYAETLIRENTRFHDAANAKSGLLHTSQPVMQSFTRRFARFVEAGSEVLCLTISSRLSGTFSNASLCAREFGGKVRVVDTRTSAAGIYFLLKEA
jgi:DegV family protein with EDD domain